jgi:hypothetical protein
MNRDELSREVVEAFARALLQSTYGFGQTVEFYLLAELEDRGLTVRSRKYVEELETYKAMHQLKESLKEAERIRMMPREYFSLAGDYLGSKE